MKTLRQILLERHKAAEPKLEDIRQNLLATLKTPGATADPAVARSTTFSWRAFVFSLRWHAAGMTAVWLVVVLLNLERAPGSGVMMAQPSVLPAQQILVSLQEHRRLLLEMIEPPPVEPATTPRRRSALRTWTEIV